MTEILPYDETLGDELMELIREEGEEWEIYWGEKNAARYRASFSSSITYVSRCDGRISGYIRALPDALFLYVCDLLVNARFRGNGIGMLLIRRLQADYPNLPTYVMSGNDEYYNKTGSKKEGSVYYIPASGEEERQ